MGTKSKLLIVLCQRRSLFFGIVLVSVLMGVAEGVKQIRETRYVGSMAQEIVRGAHATDSRSRVIALRDYLRTHVTFRNLSIDGRPFLRASAAETLRSGQGYCGEVARAFICLAAAEGIRAQRINLYGEVPHVVAEAELAPNQRVIVDCWNPPLVPELESLDRVILRPDIDDYSTLNVRRLHISGLVSRIKLEMGPLTYWTENPHTLKASLWFLLALTLLALKEARALVRILLRKRGWVHVSTLPPLHPAVVSSASKREVIP